MKKSRRQSLEKKLAVAASVVQLLNAAAPIALPYVSLTQSLSATGGHAERLSDFLARSLYGTAQADPPASNATTTVGPGETETRDTVANGGTQVVKGGTGEGASGGVGNITNLNDGGRQNVSGGVSEGKGGTGTIATMNDGLQYVYNGGTGTVTTMNGGEQRAFQNATGTVSSMSGGTQVVQSQGTGKVTSMTGSGRQNVNQGGNGTVSFMSGGSQFVYFGGVGTVETMNGGEQIVTGGSGTVSTMSGGSQVVSNGTGNITTMSGGEQTVSVGTGNIATMNNGGKQIVSNGTGTVTNMSGGEQHVSGGRATISAMNGGTQIVSGGEVSGTTMSGGTQIVSGGVVSATQLNAGSQIVSNGTVSGTTMSGGTQIVSGGTVNDTTLSAGTQIVSNGTVSGTTMNGGTQIVSGGVVSATQLNGGTQTVAAGGTVTGTTVNSGGVQTVAAGGTAKGTTVSAGGTQNVDSGGVVSGGTVAKGAALVVENGAEVKDTTVEGGWVESPDGDINGGTLKGGEYTVVSGVSVERMTLEGGTQFVEAGGRTTSTTIEKNGTQILQSGTESNTGGVSEHITLNGGTLSVGDYAWAQIDKAEGGMVELLDAGFATAIFGNVSDTAAGSYTVDTLFARGDTVILGQGNATPSPVGNKLNVGTMDGYANFVVNTDLANNVSDEIHIENAKNADKANTVRINYDPTLAAGKTVPNTKTLVATVKQGKAVFEGAESSIGGLKYLPNLVTEDGGKSWYIAAMEKKGASDNTHHTLMGMTAGMAALAAGTAYINDATDGLGLTANTGKDGVSAFAKFGGGAIRQETGSHVDVKTWNAILALGHANQKERGTFEYGAFFEYGSGNYTTHDNDLRGDGSMDYTGGGVLAKWTAAHGFYVEGSFRAGTVHDDAKNVLHDDVNTYSYDTRANYFGAHIGVGKEIEVANGNTVDVYGKFFFNRRNGVSFETGGNAYDLDAVKSEILRVGVRYTMKREKWNFYGGLAYEHEFGGEATGTVDGLAIRSADIKGGSARLELGATMKPDKNSPWSLDLNVAGFAGKKQGVSGGVSVAFMF